MNMALFTSRARRERIRQKTVERRKTQDAQHGRGRRGRREAAADRSDATARGQGEEQQSNKRKAPRQTAAEDKKKKEARAEVQWARVRAAMCSLCTGWIRRTRPRRGSRGWDKHRQRPTERAAPRRDA